MLGEIRPLKPNTSTIVVLESPRGVALNPARIAVLVDVCTRRLYTVVKYHHSIVVNYHQTLDNRSMLPSSIRTVGLLIDQLVRAISQLDNI